MELAKRKSHKMTNYDPDQPTDEMMYHCKIWARKMLNPIIDWTEDEVWDFLHKYNIPYCELYDQGFARLGCIGCPMGTVQNRLKEFERWPKYKNLYIKAFDKMIKARQDEGFDNPMGARTKKHPEIIRAMDRMTTEERFQYWLTQKMGEKKWGNDSTGEEVIKWWIR